MKKNIFINFISAKAAGGKFILENFYNEISSNPNKYRDFNFYILCPFKNILRSKKIFS
mgnify:CR=1 FL=1